MNVLVANHEDTKSKKFQVKYKNIFVTKTE